MSTRDFAQFSAALDQAFTPNPALKEALKSARRSVRRA